jgi:hypothetical protein
LQRLEVKPAAATASVAALHHDDLESAWREAWKAAVKVNAAMLPLVGLACLYISNEQQADTPAGRAKQVAEALRSATVPVERTDATNSKRPDVMAAVKTFLKPHTPQDDTVYTTVLVTGPVGSGKTVALREALSSEKGVVISDAFSSAKGDYVEAWCSSLLAKHWRCRASAAL